ncbi:MAG TPA: FAD-dependent oxidoreductase, partial [Gaiellaceae bacterium]|nr:FAD-dependent oxidoreductase [Gaiellaceae bacterium]
MADSYWLAEPHEPLPVRALDGAPDAVVVGGGVTGCSAALELARRGLRVRLHEAREIAGGASGRNGGFALRGAAAPYDVIADSVGRERALGLWRWTEEAIAELRDLAGDAFRPVGSLRLAADAEERAELRREWETMAADGVAADWIDEPGGPLEGRYPAAIFHPPDGALQPARWVRRLARLAVDAGVEIREHSRLESVAQAEADVVLVATDGYPSGLLGPLEGLIVPTRGQMIATEPLPEKLFEVPHYGRHGFDYWHQAPDGRILAGGFRDTSLDSEFTADEVTTGPIQAALEEFVADLVGWPLQVEARWAGIFGMILDFLPAVGPVPGVDGVWVAGGYSGHGNVLGYACGKLAAGAIAGDGDPLLDLFEPARLLG